MIRNDLIKPDIVWNQGVRMEKWFPPGYEPIADVFERTGETIFGAKWDSQVPTHKRLRTPPEDSEVGSQSMHVFEHLRNQFCLVELMAFILDPDFGPKRHSARCHHPNAQQSSVGHRDQFAVNAFPSD